MSGKDRRKYHYMVGDFETTVFKGQEYTEVWASAVVTIGQEDVKIFHSIADTYKYLTSLKENIIIYYHNLKFDGEFWLSYFIKNGYKQATIKTGDEDNDIQFSDPWKMQSGYFQYTISDMGQWYSIKIKYGNYIIEFRDSLKLLPFSVKVIGKAFNTKHQKLDMKYEGFRYAGCTITDKEKEYIANDVLVVSEALQEMFNEGHNKLTIGACCMSEFKATVGTKDMYNTLYPDLTQLTIDYDTYGSYTVDEYIRKSYKGGWCYLVRGKENKIYENGVTADVNSLYPSMMSSESGNEYPYGLPEFWSGDYIPREATAEHRYFFVRIRTRFYVKPDYLPFIQIKHSLFYRGNDMLETSDILLQDGTTGAYYYDENHEPQDTRVTMTLTCTDYLLLLEHYDLIDFEILDGCYFYAEAGQFDTYINKYKEQKIHSKGAKRTIAKLFLNNLYGKFASSTNSDFKYAFLDESGVIRYLRCEANDKQAGYIAIGSAVTSYSRNFTIRAAQKNYHGRDKPGFIYADTDSIHCDLNPQDLIDIPVHPTDFCHWKLESSWDKGLFVRQKTYMEHIVAEDLEPCEPYWNMKCAGLPERCKQLFLRSMKGEKARDDESEEAKEFLSKQRTLSDFKVGLRIPCKLMPKRIEGGIVLVNSYYEMR